MKPLEERNKELVLKRILDPKKWTYRALASFYHINCKTAEQIFKRDLDKYASLEEIELYRSKLLIKQA